MNLLRRLWADEPVVVRIALALAVSAGVLTATQASALGDAISAVLVAVASVTARAKVAPTSAATKPNDAGAADVFVLIALGALVVMVAILLFHGRIR